MVHNSNSPVQTLTEVRWTLLQHIWSINCSLHKLWVSFCDLRVLPVGKFQRDFFVKCISFCANISSGILHRKCANKSHSKRCNFPWADQKVKMQVFLSDCPKGNLSFSQNFDAFEQLVTRQRLLKFDESPPIGKHVGLFVKYDSKLHQSWYRVIPYI